MKRQIIGLQLKRIGLLFLILFTCFGDSTGQNSPKAKKHYEKVQKLIQSGKGTFLEISAQLNKALSAEKELEEEADFDFIGELLFLYARYFISEDYYGVASQFFYLSALSYQTGDNFSEAQKSLQQSAMFYDSSLKYQSKYFQNGDSLGRRYIRFPIQRLDSTRGDTTWYTMQLGTRDSIYPNQTGSVITIYDKNNPKREVEYYGAAKVQHVEFGRSHWYVVIDEEFKDKGIKLQAGDLVYTQVIHDHNAYDGLISALVKMGVVLQDDYKHSLYTYRTAMEIHKEKQENLILDMMVEMVKSTAKSLYDPETTTSNMDPLEGGGYKGVNMWEAMLATTREDMAAFLRFVKDYPGKYMGRKYRIDETYATWLINNTPTSGGESEYIKEKYKAISSEEDLDAWINQYARYMDAAEMNYDFVFNEIYELTIDQKYPEADSITRNWLRISEKLKLDSLNLELEVQRARILSAQKRYDDAIEVFLSVLKKDENHVNGIWHLANTYLENEEYSRALKKYQVLMDMYPEASAGHGMYGWTLLKMAKNQEALEHLKTAYLLDSFTSTYIMNYGHGLIVMNKPQEARRIYKRLLENLEDTSVFYQGLIADFDFFIDNGRKVQEFRVEKNFALSEWNKHFIFKTLGNQYFEEGKTLEDKEKFSEAAQKFDSAIHYERLGLFVRYKTLRNYHRWAAFNYYKDANHPVALARYREAWDINRNYINDASLEIKDLEAISNEYSWLDNDVMEDMYEKMQHAAQRKLQSNRRSNVFYMISIGLNGDSTTGYQKAEKDAEKIAEVVSNKTGLVFDESHIEVINSQSTKKEDVDSAIGNVIANSLPGDCFLLYYSGPTKNDRILLDSSTISNEEILAWLSQMSATKKIVLVDAANASLVPAFIEDQNDNQRDFTSESITFLISDGRVEMPEAEGGLFTSYLINGINGGAATSWKNTYIEEVNQEQQIAYVTSKSLEGYMYGTMSSGNLQFDLKSYSSGVDFPLTFINSATFSVDTIPPMIYLPNVISSEGKRGGKTKRVTVKKSINGQALDESGIAEITVNGQPVNFSQNGKFVLNEKFAKTWTKLVITAKDKRGNTATDSFTVNLTEETYEDPTQNEDEPVNYALLFATSNYSEWSNLENPKKDVTTIAELLEKSYGFKVQVVEDATKHEMETVLLSYMQKSYGPKDQLFVFFAGHGHYDLYNRGYVVASNSKLDDPTMSSYLRFKQITDDLNDMYNCRHIFIALDVCFGGKAFDKTGVTNYSGSTLEDILKKPQYFIESTLEIKSRIFMTSGSVEYVPDESLFAMKFVETLRSKGAAKNGILTLDDFTDNLKSLTLPTAKVPTTPRYGTFGDHEPFGDFLFIYSNTSTPKSDGMTKTQTLAEKKQ